VRCQKTSVFEKWFHSTSEIFILEPLATYYSPEILHCFHISWKRSKGFILFVSVLFVEKIIRIGRTCAYLYTVCGIFTSLCIIIGDNWRTGMFSVRIYACLGFSLSISGI